jgi:PAS domain-containing protein
MAQNVMSGYYGQPYQQSVDQNRSIDSFMQQSMVTDIVPGMLDTTMTGEEGQTLDQIISQNELELQRRRSTYNPGFSPNGDQRNHARRSSGMEFGAPKHQDRADFPFNPSPPQPSMPGQIPDPERSRKESDPRRIRSRESLALDTRFNHMNPAFGSMSSYSPAMMTSTPLDLDPTSQFLSANMEIPMSFENAGGDRTPMNIQPQIEQQPMFTASPTPQPFSPMFQGLGQDSPASRNQSMDQSLMDKVSRMGMPDSMHNMSVMNNQGNSPRSVMPLKRGSGGSTMTSPPRPPPTSVPQPPNPDTRSTYGNGSKDPKVSRERNRTDTALVINGSATELVDHGPGKPPEPKFVNIYAPSGFDMLGVLVSVLVFYQMMSATKPAQMRVAARPKPEINIGPVDLSCAFVVCDISLPDMPIVYCSDVFERLTAYTNYEIVGRNCRFLQAPDGKVQPGVRRKYVDDSSVLSLKNKIARREEIQLSLINYRKGGQPFMNLLTMIPVPWDTLEFKYYVGFQVDLVEQPNSVAGRNPGMKY